jgi:hypothetical protein
LEVSSRNLEISGISHEVEQRGSERGQLAPKDPRIEEIGGASVEPLVPLSVATDNDDLVLA